MSPPPGTSPRRWPPGSATRWPYPPTYVSRRRRDSYIVPLGRVGEPADIADAVVFLASHQARWITGQVLQVAGGHAL
ncbi:SDR family oxidoreductase [Nonomuraea sp. NPDC049028]|uniref:SDR family oxidoreductase n=1 Tax=Nonomuraea sp. NPDC049028 TaxID=3364348 RepID=UPI00371B4072